MTEPAPHSPPDHAATAAGPRVAPKRRRRWRLWLLLAVCLVPAALAGAYKYLTAPKQFAFLAEKVLTYHLGGRVEIDAAQFSLTGPLQITGFRLLVPGMPHDAQPLFTAQRILIEYDPWQLLKARFWPTRVSFEQPTLYLTEDLDREKFNFLLLLEQRQSDNQPPAEHWPEVYLGQARTVFGEVRRGKYRQIESVDLTGNLVAEAGRPTSYKITLIHKPTDDTLGTTLEASFDTHAMTASAMLERFALDSPLLKVLPHRVRQWWDRLEPTGQVPPIVFGYAPNTGFYAQLEVHNFALTLPYGELESRMTDVSGLFQLREQTITLVDLTGRIEDIDYVINGLVKGFTADAPFDLTATFSGEIPPEPRYLFAMPRAVQKQFYRFQPAGQFDANVRLVRISPSAPIDYDGRVALHGVTSTYWKFPYPLSDVNGQMIFDNTALSVDGLRARGPTGAELIITGRAEPPGDGAALDIQIVANNMPLDQYFYDALATKPKRQKIYDMFFDRDAHQKLVDAAVLAPDQPQQPETPVPHRFPLGGNVDAVVHIERAYGPDEQSRVTTTVHRAHANVLFRYWPYPLQPLGGKLIIGPDEVTLEHVTLRGLTGGEVILSGRAILPGDDRGPGLIPEITIEARNIPIDNLLFASIPSPQDQWVRQLDVQGILSGAGRVYRTDEGDIDFDIDTHFVYGSARPYDGRYLIDNLTGNLALHRHGVEIKAVHGLHADSQVTLDGAASWQGEAAGIKLHLAARNMKFEDPVLDLIPRDQPSLRRLQTLFDRHRPRGLFDARLDYNRPADEPSDYALKIEPRSLDLLVRDRDIHLDITQGHVAVTPATVAINEIAANFDGGGMRMTGTIGAGDQHDVDVVFAAHADNINHVTRAVLPTGVLKAIDGLELDGAYDTQNARLTYHPDAQAGPLLTFSADIDWSNAHGHVGVPITQLDGRLTVAAQLDPQSECPALDLQLEAVKLRALDRLVQNARVRVVSADPYNLLLIPSITGHCYNGLIAGRGSVDVGPTISTYRLDLVMQDVAHEPFLDPKNDQAWLAANSLESYPDQRVVQRPSRSARVSANLLIDGVAGDPASRRGSGQIIIRDAEMFRTPLAMAVLHIVNLNLPGADAFDLATARYTVDGNLIRIDRVSFEATTVEVVGSGLLHYGDQTLDLELYSRSPADSAFGPLSELVNVFKDELLTIHVTGTLAEPKTDVQTLSGIGRSLTEIFGPSQHAQPPPVLGTAP